MNEIINGGTTSIGAQLRRLQHASIVPDPFRTSDTGERLMTVHAVIAAGDFPAIAALLPCKGSVSAHRYDRKSTQDNTSYLYGETFSLLHPYGEGAFRYVLHARLCINQCTLPSAHRHAGLSLLGGAAPPTQPTHTCTLHTATLCNLPLYCIPLPPR